MEHCEIGGSNIERIVECPGSVALCRRAPPSIGSHAAEEGTLAHKMLETSLELGLEEPLLLEKSTSEMAAAVKIALVYLTETASFKKAAIQTEKFVLFDKKRFDERVGGTADVIIEGMRHREIVDFKYGYIPVEATSLQLAFYGISAFGISNPIVCTVIQPRAFHEDGPIRSIKYTSAELRQLRYTIRKGIEAALSEKISLNPSEKSCRFCKAASYCPALQGKVQEVIEADLFDQQAVLPDPSTFNEERLGQILPYVSLVRKWLEQVENTALNAAISGKNIPGYKLVNASSRQKWAAEEDMVPAILAEQSGKDRSAFLKQSPLTITEATACLTKHYLDEGISPKEARAKARQTIAFATVKEPPRSGAFTLVSNSDKREAVVPSKVFFNNVSLTPISE